MRWTGFLPLVCAAALTIGCGDRPGRESGTEGGTDQPPVGTAGEGAARDIGAAVGLGGVHEFVRDAARAGNAEVQLGQLASERASSNDVRQFGQQMVKDHTDAANQLQAAASPYDIRLPADLDEHHRDLMERLQGLRGIEFDREYMEAMVEGHEKVRDMLRGRADEAREARQTVGAAAASDRSEQGEQGGADTRQRREAQLEIAVNQWAAGTLPTVERHLQRAQQIQQRLENQRTDSANRPNREQ